MREHTTMRVGGPADLFLSPASPDQVLFILDTCARHQVPVAVVGNGSNLIVRDKGIRGAVLHLGQAFSAIEELPGCRLQAQSGASLSRLAQEALKSGLSGLEFASGIPGSVGGGVAMNAGAYGGELKDVLETATVLKDGKIITMTCGELEAGHRTTRVLREGGIVLSAVFRLESGDPDAIRSRMDDLNARRRDKQPLQYASSGSTFKRPAGHFAGALIEGCGLKGFRVGGASVSVKHAGFVINDRDATAGDVLSLIREIQERVLRETGVSLETEVRVLGEA
ncbi:MAG: UDP-N-acetylmuramate dehydrogenase [Clostridia bacterium]|nr:UDP-N-acetylmuramate dehydrogenase [Clostridia bacterium]